LNSYSSNCLIPNLIHFQLLIYDHYLSEVIYIAMSLNFLLNTSWYCSLMPVVTQVRLITRQGFQRSLPPHAVLMCQSIKRNMFWTGTWEEELSDLLLTTLF
jgi:hypothetical protein